jgi:uncharacterized membrane protein YhaH (DUF805 family)
MPDGTYGQIAADDGKRYSYWTSEVRNGRVAVGQAVEFQMWEGQPIDIYVVDHPPPPTAAPPPRPGVPQQRAFGVGQAGTSFVPAGGAAAPAGAGFGPIPTSRDYWITLFTSPSGRISRRQFWLHGMLVIVVCDLLLTWIPLIGQLLALALLWGSICIGFKRFHDVGYPGWWSLVSIVPFFASAVLFSLSFYFYNLAGLLWLLTEVLAGIGLLIALAQLIFVYIRPGQQGPNQYGPDPLAAA